MNLATSAPRAIEPGHRLDRYELLCPIAEGGMAHVWLARIEGKRGFEKLVAIKMILPQFAEDMMFQEMLLDESRIASRIEHINVAQILDLGEHHDILYLVLEWVEGESLSRLARAVANKTGHGLPHGILLRVLSDACGGLHAAHELRGPDGELLGVVHRDMSPQNILVSTAGVAKLIDFGIAKAKDRLGGDTSSGVLKGKVRYMAPEQALGKSVDRRADLWAVGSMLYRLLSGRAPYQGENELASLNLLTAGWPPAPLPASVHPSVAAVVNRALSHDPDGRFATAADMKAAMERAMVEAGIETTQSDVAAFAGGPLASLTDKRQTSLKLALRAAAERQRVCALLQPMVNPEPPTDVSRVIPAAGSSEPTLPETVRDYVPPMVKPPPLPEPEPSVVIELTERLDPARPARASMPSEPPTSSFDTSLRALGTSPWRQVGLIAVGGVVTFLAVLVLLAMVGGSHGKTAAARPEGAMAQSSPAVSPPPPRATAAPALTETPAVDPAPTFVVPVIAATDLPRVPAPPEALAKPRPPALVKAALPATPAPEDATTSTAPAPAASSAPEGDTKAQVPPVRTRVDDGF